MEDEAPKKRGRPKGSYSKASKAQVARLTDKGKLSPLDYLASIYQEDPRVATAKPRRPR